MYLLYLGRSLVQRGHEVLLWASSHARMDELAAKFSAFGEVIRSPYRNMYDRPGRSLATCFNFATSREAAAEWRRCKPDLIHINKQNLEDGLDLLRATGHVTTPTICTIHLTQTAAYFGARFAGVRDFVARHALEKYRGPLVAVLANREHDLVQFLGDFNRIHMIPNGVPLADLTQREPVRKSKRADLRMDESHLLIAAVGRMVPQKRPMLFLEIAAKIHARFPEARFVWVGDGSLSGDWDRWVKEHGLSQIITRIPWQADVQPFLFAADAFLHVAEYEGLPLAILEAMSAALPCAVRDNLLSEMPFLNATNSISAGEDDAWIELLGNRQSLSSRGAAARQLVEREFSYDQMAASYEALYERLLAGTGSR